MHKFVKTKKELLDYEIEGIGVGVDIYESYLKNGKPTIDFDDTIFWETVELGITNYIFWRDFFNLNKVKGVLVSHDCYIDMNILCKIAYKKDIGVFLANARGLHRSNSQYSIYENRFNNYKSRFKTLSLNDQRKAITWSKSQLQKKLSGEVGVDAAYSLASSFQLNSNSNKKTFLIKIIKLKCL